MSKNKPAKKSDKLTVTESKRYSELLESIHARQRGFVEMGAEIMELAEKRLWREEFKTWAAFCENRIGMTAQHVKLLIRASEFVKSVPKRIQEHIPSVKAAIGLSRLENPERAERIVESLAKEGTVTEAAVLDRLPAPKSQAPAPAPKLTEPAEPKPAIAQKIECPLCGGIGSLEKLDEKFRKQLEKLIKQA